MKKKFISYLAVAAISFFIITKAHSVNNPYQADSALQLTPPQAAGHVYQDVNGNMVTTYPNVIITNLFISSYTLTALQTSTPAATGQIVWCANCANTLLVIATGTTTGAWAGVVNSTGSVLQAPK